MLAGKTLLDYDNLFSLNDYKKNNKIIWALKRNLSSTRVAPFDFNSQQDLAEILQVVLNELKGVSLAASSLISNTKRTTVPCNTCLCFFVSEEKLDILPL